MREGEVSEEEEGRGSVLVSIGLARRLLVYLVHYTLRIDGA
jgi:hypothetical protein